MDCKGLTGGAEGIRTPDLRSAIAALSQLSYGPVAHAANRSDAVGRNEWRHLGRALGAVKDWPSAQGAAK